MADLLKSMPYLLENEGGYTVDDGGPTMYGITIPDVAAYRHVPANTITPEDMKNLTVMEATEIYRFLYWDKMCLDALTSQGVATCIFDTGVNRGTGVAMRYAQRVCNQLGLKLNIDGEIGPITLRAINSFNPNPFIKAYETLEFAGYEAILASNPKKYEIYRKGWEARAKKLLTLMSAKSTAV